MCEYPSCVCVHHMHMCVPFEGLCIVCVCVCVCVCIFVCVVRAYTHVGHTHTHTHTRQDIVVPLAPNVPIHFLSHTHLSQNGSKDYRLVAQFHFVSWPDFGVPRTPVSLLHFLQRVRLHQPSGQPQPIVIHCR